MNTESLRPAMHMRKRSLETVRFHILSTEPKRGKSICSSRAQFHPPKCPENSVLELSCKESECEGQKTTCDQCNFKQLECVYSRNGNYDSKRNWKTNRARDESNFVAKTKVSSAGGEIRPEPECHTAEAGLGFESTNP
ncbi:hypothetical protein GGP41_008384 [Bipolaris sorokiniana]|uniref:Zn(2)-C6 fungal-type domain-containing protein n=1 Tax=Cochliobolus sativus TaxID=45130 RepID=A0A8H5ZAU2_COCSA|nr:hypothetical protein GGP41_008384 [Bipolaris sorokiniana]